MSGSAREQRPRQAILGQLARITRADGSPIRVLLVDDEPALTNLVKWRCTPMSARQSTWCAGSCHSVLESPHRGSTVQNPAPRADRRCVHHSAALAAGPSHMAAAA
jgi:hypothetical protein